MRRYSVLIAVLNLVFALRAICWAEVHELSFPSAGATLKALLLTPEGLVADSLGTFDAREYRRQLEVGVGEE